MNRLFMEHRGAETQRIILRFSLCFVSSKKRKDSVFNININEVFMKSIIIAIGLGGWCMHAYAQEQAPDPLLTLTVVVENPYNPEVMAAFKFNLLPAVATSTVPKQHPSYALSCPPLSLC